MNGTIYFIYKYKIPYFEQYRIDNLPWPWEEDYQQWREFLNKTLKLVAFNGLVILPVAYSGLYILFGDIPFSYSTETIPSSVFAEIIPQLYFCMAIEDTYYYFMHRVFHSKTLYPLFHKLHH